MQLIIVSLAVQWQLRGESNLSTSVYSEKFLMIFPTFSLKAYPNKL